MTDQTATAHAEYLRRNLVVAGSIGASAGCRVILDRLSMQKRAPMWLVRQIEAIKERVDHSTPELCDWRAASPDIPVYENGVKIR